MSVRRIFLTVSDKE